ncbi:MAG TPA: M20/M25/M40 family metallo-hydrolase [Candidatus Acidoferrales bacterium]|jgi:acetylornithine deacetylase/succinyl-diaminopimelate desuccinylase-like protein|nr:M20/M25/M40 family metallo-hydrolase [Candidatus Acidoferrales bacterium]
MLKSWPLLCLAAGGLVGQTLPPDSEKQLARDIYKQLIEIRSGYTTGATTPAAEAMAARLRAGGFPESEIFVGGPIPTKANLVVRYRGTGVRKPILLLAHTDVVEAKREDWSMDPYQLIERDGYFYGRGTGDDKAQAAVWIAILIRYQREGFKPDRDIIVALTADEEGGGPYNGVQWLLKNHRELIEAEFCLNEGGWGEIAGGRKVSNDVQVSEKYVINFRLEVHNKGGHSSVPVPDNAVYHLAAALDKLSKAAFPLKTNEVTRAYFQAIAKIETGQLKSDLAKVAEGSPDAMERVAHASPVWNATLRTTCVATQIEGGHAKNALPQLAAANVNCRVLSEDSTEYVQSTLQKIIADEQVHVTIDGEVMKGPPSPMREDLFKAASRLTDTMWPGVPAVPIMVMGATDGLYLRANGIPTYGIQGFFMDRDDIRFHGRDERMLVSSFYEGQAFLYELVKALAR